MFNDPAKQRTPQSASALSPSDLHTTEALRYGREYDWIGHHIATILAMVYLFLLPLMTMPKDAAFGVLAGWTIIRLPHTWRSYGALARMPILWVTLAWVGWQALSFLWSSDLSQAWDEFKVQRMLVTPLLLWPILDRARVADLGRARRCAGPERRAVDAGVGLACGSRLRRGSAARPHPSDP